MSFMDSSPCITFIHLNADQSTPERGSSGQIATMFGLVITTLLLSGGAEAQYSEYPFDYDPYDYSYGGQDYNPSDFNNIDNEYPFNNIDNDYPFVVGRT